MIFDPVQPEIGVISSQDDGEVKRLDSLVLRVAELSDPDSIRKEIRDLSEHDSSGRVTDDSFTDSSESNTIDKLESYDR